MLIFKHFISRYENFKSRDSSSTRNLTPHSAWTTHLMRECCNSVDIMPRGCRWAVAPGKWNDGQEAVAVSNYKARPSLSCTRVLSDPTDRPLSSQAHHTLWLWRLCNCPTMNSLSRTDGLGRVYSLEWFSKSWSVADAVLIRRRIQRMCSLLNDPCLLGLLTPLTLRVYLPFPHQWTYSGYRLDS